MERTGRSGLRNDFLKKAARVNIYNSGSDRIRISRPWGPSLLWRAAAMALRAVWAYKLRGLFVALAVGLGIASLALIVASVDGAQRKAREIVEWFGPDAAFVLGGDIRSRAVGRRSNTLSLRDAQRVRESLPGAYLVVPMRAKRSVTLRHGNKNMILPVVVGATDNYANAWNWPLVEGRDLTPQDVVRGAKVGLIGDGPAKELFGDASPLGKTVFVDDLPIRIVGRLIYRGTSGGGSGGNVDDRLVIPLSTLTQRFNLDRKYFRALRVKFLEPEYMGAHVENLRAMLRDMHNLEGNAPDDFTILTADEILKFLSMLQGSLVAFLGVTAAVAVLAGGFVLANLFYLSVSERTREVGLKKALGAKAWTITAQFLFEAVLLTCVGGVCGIIMGVGLAEALSSLGMLEVRLSPRVVVISLAAAVGIGLVFGIRPARRAANMDPIQALRGGD